MREVYTSFSSRGLAALPRSAKAIEAKQAVAHPSTSHKQTQWNLRLRGRVGTRAFLSVRFSKSSHFTRPAMNNSDNSCVSEYA